MATGGPFTLSGGAFQPQLVFTSLAPFPSGPYSHSAQSYFDFSENGSVTDVAAGGSGLFAFAETHGTSHGEIFLADSTGLHSPPLSNPQASYENPAMAATNPQFVFFEALDLIASARDIVFRPANILTFVGTPTRLPAIVNSFREESQPAVTADGRYLAFVRDAGTFGDYLFVWDSQTQTLLNPNGVQLGGFTVDTRRRGGSVSLYTKPVLKGATISSSGTVTLSLVSTSSVGILVQRIVGRTEILMQPAYELEPVGRVPLGTSRTQPRSTTEATGAQSEAGPCPGPWTAVGGLNTPRAVEGTIALELGRPHRLVIADRR